MLCINKCTLGYHPGYPYAKRRIPDVREVVRHRDIVRGVGGFVEAYAAYCEVCVIAGVPEGEEAEDDDRRQKDSWRSPQHPTGAVVRIAQMHQVR